MCSKKIVYWKSNDFIGYLKVLNFMLLSKNLLFNS